MGRGVDAGHGARLTITRLRQWPVNLLSMAPTLKILVGRKALPNTEHPAGVVPSWFNGSVKLVIAGGGGGSGSGGGTSGQSSNRHAVVTADGMAGVVYSGDQAGAGGTNGGAGGTVTSSWNGYGGSAFRQCFRIFFFPERGYGRTRLQFEFAGVSEAAEAVGCGAQEVAEAIRAVEATPVTRSEAEAVHSTPEPTKATLLEPTKDTAKSSSLIFRHYGLAPQQRPRCLVSSRREWHGSVGNRKSCHRIRCNADRRPTWRSGKSLLSRFGQMITSANSISSIYCDQLFGLGQTHFHHQQPWQPDYLQG